MGFGNTNKKERDLRLFQKLKNKELPRSAGEKCDIDLVDAIGIAMTA